MAIAVQILGEPGTGKTFSMRNLDHMSTMYVNCDKKSMPFQGWRKLYNKENRNYIHSSNAADIETYLKVISDKRPDIKVVLIDTVNTIMSDKEMAERKKQGFDK